LAGVLAALNVLRGRAGAGGASKAACFQKMQELKGVSLFAQEAREYKPIDLGKRDEEEISSELFASILN
jgi:shikimate 5-dehydrogenase